MPWKTSDVKKYNGEITGKVAKRQWVHVANGVLAKTGDEGRAIAEANAVVERRKDKGKK